MLCPESPAASNTSAPRTSRPGKSKVSGVWKSEPRIGTKPEFLTRRTASHGTGTSLWWAMLPGWPT